MRAAAKMRYVLVADSRSLLNIELKKPKPAWRHISMRFNAVCVNPIDVWIGPRNEKVEHTSPIFGWSVAGVVEAAGVDVCHFPLSNAVFYAGDASRQAENSEFRLVDEQIVSGMRSLLGSGTSAELPITMITAWKSLFLRLGISLEGRHEGRSILIIGPAGAVGSIAVQLASRLARLTVVATASCRESMEWARQQGADYVVNHFLNIPSQVRDAGFDHVDYTLILNGSDEHFMAAVEITPSERAICLAGEIAFKCQLIS
jgi:NADPH2:quinone reductase